MTPKRRKEIEDFQKIIGIEYEKVLLGGEMYAPDINHIYAKSTSTISELLSEIDRQAKVIKEQKAKIEKLDPYISYG